VSGAVGSADRDAFAEMNEFGVAFAGGEREEKEAREHLGPLVFETVIPRNVKLSEAPSHGVPAILYDHRCSGSVAYMMLAKEMLSREQDFKIAS
jgi:chromosome partitioning protein